MTRRNSLLSRCLTPKASLPAPLVWLAGLSGWLALLGLWAGLSYGGVIPSMFLPTPGQVLDAGQRLAADGTLDKHVLASLEVVLIGFSISALVSVPLGLLMGSFRIVQAILEPLVNFIRYLPVTSFVPLFILWIGIGLEQRVAVIIFGVFFQQLVMIADVSRGVSKDLINASYTLGANRRDVIFHVLGPASLPGILDTLRVTMGWAWTYLVVAELVAASSGLGYISLKAMRGFQVDVIFLAIAIIGLLGLITDQLFRFLRLKVTAWAQ
ncbi:ABC transporter permease [Stutzerimonas kirkiae]|uniref:ABC transporter permease n=1 Tax=Stutzerimonas kirkiae TaxID=2211392 RepID=A0A4Q9RDG1_9GAMM|nr:ABC transporter permease [Stutzerimonas kirkiae]TBU98542.1 ABC transporter permease [Stutzerimonas kirkiae]TBV04283.1 ABC transporter permease [Stutzerimonas kirkiae]TBV10987.1 ABC transporter permease [Stutzerimonas kirkiae]TBV14346.1 ABC transporter permease [Stutzerimonas kirkiae]